MRYTDIAPSLYNRLFTGRRPLVLLGVGIGLCVIHYWSANFKLNYVLYVATLIFPYALVALAPVPWQWTGDDSPKVRPLRGMLQSLVFNGIWMWLFVACIWIWGPDAAPPDKSIARQVLIARLGLGVFTWVATIGFGWIWSEKEAIETRERTTAELLRQAQCRALQSQLEPHVLYNALNSLAGLIQEDPLAAEDVVVRLAQLYRMLTKRGGSDRIPLSEERRLVEAYLAMEQMRLGERLKTEWVWAVGADEVRVPPLFLQPLVENAIKHGISPTEEGGRVVITYDRQGAAHVLQVANTGQAPEQDAPKGVGMGNLEARLALLADAEGSLALTRQGDWTLATVRWVPKGVA